MSPGAAIGGTIGGLIGLVVLVVAIVCCARWKWRKNSSDVESSHNASNNMQNYILLTCTHSLCGHCYSIDADCQLLQKLLNYVHRVF